MTSVACVTRLVVSSVVLVPPSVVGGSSVACVGRLEVLVVGGVVIGWFVLRESVVVLGVVWVLEGLESC